MGSEMCIRDSSWLLLRPDLFRVDMSLVVGTDEPSYLTSITWTSATTFSDGAIYSLVLASAVEYVSETSASGGVAVRTDVVAINTIYGTVSSPPGTASTALSTTPSFSMLATESQTNLVSSAAQPSIIVQTIIAAPASSSSAPPDGLAVSAKAGIGIGSALGALLILGLAATTYKLYHRDPGAQTGIVNGSRTSRWG